VEDAGVVLFAVTEELRAVVTEDDEVKPGFDVIGTDGHPAPIGVCISTAKAKSVASKLKDVLEDEDEEDEEEDEVGLLLGFPVELFGFSLSSSSSGVGNKANALKSVRIKPANRILE
jgi:hypothetical protein